MALGTMEDQDARKIIAARTREIMTDVGNCIGSLRRHEEEVKHFNTPHDGKNIFLHPHDFLLGSGQFRVGTELVTTYMEFKRKLPPPHGIWGSFDIIHEPLRRFGASLQHDLSQHGCVYQPDTPEGIAPIPLAALKSQMTLDLVDLHLAVPVMGPEGEILPRETIIVKRDGTLQGKVLKQLPDGEYETVRLTDGDQEITGSIFWFKAFGQGGVNRRSGEEAQTLVNYTGKDVSASDKLGNVVGQLIRNYGYNPVPLLEDELAKMRKKLTPDRMAPLLILTMLERMQPAGNHNTPDLISDLAKLEIPLPAEPLHAAHLDTLGPQAYSLLLAKTAETMLRLLATDLVMQSPEQFQAAREVALNNEFKRNVQAIIDHTCDPAKPAVPEDTIKRTLAKARKAAEKLETDPAFARYQGTKDDPALQLRAPLALVEQFYARGYKAAVMPGGVAL